MTFGDDTIQSTTSVLDTELCALKSHHLGSTYNQERVERENKVKEQI